MATTTNNHLSTAVLPPSDSYAAAPAGSYPIPRLPAEQTSNLIIAAFKITLEEVGSYIHHLESRVRAEEEYIRALRACSDRPSGSKLDARVGAFASALPGASNLPGPRQIWREFQDDSTRQIESRHHFIEALKTYSLVPLKSFHDAQDRIRRRVKEDIRAASANLEEGQNSLKRIKKNYDRACEAVDQLKSQQAAAEEQQALLQGIAKSPPTSDDGRLPSSSSNDYNGIHNVSPGSSTGSPRRATSWKVHRPGTSSNNSPRSAGQHGGDLPRVSFEQQQQQSQESHQPGFSSFSPPNAYDTAGSPSSGAHKKNASAIFEALRNRETWDQARKEVGKKTNALIHKMKEAGPPGVGSPPLGSSMVGLGGVSMEKSGSADAAGSLQYSMSTKQTQFLQSMALKLSRTKRESQDADKAYRRAIFDVETLALRRERTLSAARTSVLDCRKELAVLCSQSWLALAHNWQTLSTMEASLASHLEEAVAHLGSNATHDISVLEARLPLLDKTAEDGPIPYINYWHGEYRSLLFGVSLVDYDFARSQRGPPQLGEQRPMEPPLILTKCIKFIESTSLDLPGIYRTSAKHSTIQELCASFEKDETLFQLQEDQHDPVAVAGVLKQWLRELPSSVMPMPWQERIKLTHSVEEQRNDGFSSLKARIRRLPPINQVTLRTIVQHLALIASHSDRNLMTASNLSIIFGPVLLSEGDASAEGGGQTSLAAAMEEDSVAELLITYSKELFELDRAGAPVLPALTGLDGGQRGMDIGEDVASPRDETEGKEDQQGQSTHPGEDGTSVWRSGTITSSRGYHTPTAVGAPSSSSFSSSLSSADENSHALAELQLSSGHQEGKEQS